MKYLHLLRKNLGRRKVRTVFTVLSIFVAFVLFTILSALKTGFEGGVELAGADRLITIHKVSIIQPLPEAYEADIEAVEGVLEAAHAVWFGGVYQDPKNFFAQMAVEPEEWLAMHPELVLTEAEREAWIADRIGAVAGEALAERFGWEVGDRIPIQGTIWQRKDGSRTWEFNLRGIYEGAEEGTDDTGFFFQHEFLDEARAFGEGLVGWYVVKIADPQRAAEIAEAVDEEFANSPAETKTTTEKAFVQAFANQIGDVGAIVTGILAAVFFTMLLVAGNTMAQAVRERTGELAVLKTLGFTDGKVLGLVLGESVLVAVVGGALGLAVGWVVVSGLASELGAFLPAVYVRPRDLALGAALVVFVGAAAGILPALQAMRLEVVEALRR